MKKSIGNAALLGAMCLAMMPMAPVYAANWVYVGENTNNAAWYYDSETIQRSGNQVTVWEKIDASRDKTVKMRESKARARYDCAERTRTLLQVTTYYPNGKNETDIAKTYEQEEDAITPDTMADAMFEAVCQ